MNFEVKLRLEAEHDLEDVQLYYNNISEKLTLAFLTEFFETIGFIEYEPELYQVRYRDVRIAPLHSFPYGIYYLIKTDHVIVLRVLHTSRYFK